MELFKETNIDFLGKKALTLGLSALLIVATLISLAAKGGRVGGPERPGLSGAHGAKVSPFAGPGLSRNLRA